MHNSINEKTTSATMKNNAKNIYKGLNLLNQPIIQAFQAFK